MFVTPTPGLWFDPPFAESYTYVLSGGALFSEFATPPEAYGFGSLLFEDLLRGTSFVAAPSQVYDIAGLSTRTFRISGIAPGLMDFEDPDFPVAFPVFLNWTGTATNLEITANEIPEPATYGLMMVGVGVLAWSRRRRLHN